MVLDAFCLASWIEWSTGEDRWQEPTRVGTTCCLLSVKSTVKLPHDEVTSFHSGLSFDVNASFFCKLVQKGSQIDNTALPI